MLYLVEKQTFIDRCVFDLFRSVMLEKLTLPAAVLKCGGWQSESQYMP